MIMNQVWMVRAGEGAYLIEEFKRGYVGIGWQALGDLSSFKSRENIRSLYLQKYADEKSAQSNIAVGTIFKFRTAIGIDDKVISYDSTAREYLIGTVCSDYFYDLNAIKDYHHLRRVKWEGNVSRDKLTVSTRNSLGSVITLFSIN
jgi:restriction system protein